MCPQRRTSWSRQDIRSARRVALAPLLKQRGFRLRPTGSDNYEVTEHAGIIIKNWYWRCPARNLCGNSIDFFVDVLAMSFNQAMQAILNDNPKAVTLPAHNAARSAAGGRPKRGNSDTNHVTSSARGVKTVQP